uniref:Peptidase S1 domain-containing protein n=1 Tax=Cyprinus carpio TaxID=7962 RepID=A0A8C1JIC0_CYPCA
MVSVQKNWLQICGGFLISDYSETLTVVVGAHDLKNKTEGSVCIRVKSYHQHPDFTEEPVMNDMMLLKLEKKVTQNEKVNRISIPIKEEEIEVHSVCSVAGWGRLDTNGSLSNRLMEIHVKIMNNIICTVSTNGDSGGPLVCGKTAVGVTSFGDPNLCNSPELPEVYMKVSAYLQWLHTSLLEMFIDLIWP